MRPVTVSLEVDARQGLIANSYVFSGLAALHRAGEIRLEIRAPARSDGSGYFGEVFVRFEVGGPGGSVLPVCYDLRDRSDHFFHDHLRDAAVYFKRSYHGPDVDELPGDVRAKVHPGGATFACLAPGVRFAPLGHGLRLLTRPGFVGRRTVVRNLADYVRIPSFTHMIHPPAGAKRDIVLFQTRVWHESEVPSPDSAAEVNEQRVALVRALRAAFGARFVGGLVPTAVALERWPELVTPLAADRKSYLRLIREAAIAVYSRGLHHSTAYKLGECLAASCALVSDPIRAVLPSPLEPGRHLELYRSPEECVGHCDRLLTIPEEQRALRAGGHEYFQREIRPDARMRAALRTVLEATLGADSRF